MSWMRSVRLRATRLPDDVLGASIRMQRARLGRPVCEEHRKAMKVSLGIFVEEAVRRGVDYGESPTPNVFFEMGGAL